jgi:hypothetical protein
LKRKKLGKKRMIKKAMLERNSIHNICSLLI